MKSAIYVFIVSFAVGVFARSFLDIDFYFASFLILVSVACTAVYFSGKSKKSIALALTALIFLGISLGVMRFSAAEVEDNPFPDLVGEEVDIVGVISEEPIAKDKYRRAVIDVSSLNGEVVESEGLRVVVFLNFFPEVSYGDEVAVQGSLEAPERFETEEGRTFDYKSYLAKDRISYQLFWPETEVVSSSQGNFIKRTLFNLKGAFLDKTQKLIPEPESALLGGVLLGTEDALGEDLEEKFRETGLIHIVVLSGYNVTIVAEFIGAFVGFFLSPLLASIAAIASIVVFAIMVGGNATVVRASIMAILVVIARRMDRRYEIGRALMIAGFVMVLHNPYILVFDPSFQLSFIATLGLIFLAEPLERYFLWVTKRFGAREIFTATIATQIFVLPFILYKMGLFSTVALPANLLVLPIVPLTMLLGFIAGIVAFIFTPLALPFAYLAYALLSFEVFVVETLSSLPFAAFTVPSFPLWIVVLTYLVYGWGILHLFKKTPSRQVEGV